MRRLVCALSADGWATARSRRRTRLVRRFASESEYRAAVAKARFTVAAHLTASQPVAYYAVLGNAVGTRDQRQREITPERYRAGNAR